MHARITNETNVDASRLAAQVKAVDKPAAGPQGWLRAAGPDRRGCPCTDDFHADDFHTAAARVIAELAGCTDPDPDPDHARAWTRAARRMYTAAAHLTG
jgi:hypothetical protein